MSLRILLTGANGQLDRALRGSAPAGVQVRATGSDELACAWYELAEAIASEADELGMLVRRREILGVLSDQSPTSTRRSSWSVLECRHLLAIQGITQSNWGREPRQVVRQLADEGAA